MSPPIEDRYFEWLYNHFHAVRNRNPARTYWELARQLHSTEFVWLVANDDNRVEDGTTLRADFIHEQGSDGVTDEWLTLGCSVLEMLIALAMRANFQNGAPVADWFQIFIKNLGFGKFTDAKYDTTVMDIVAKRLDAFIYRNYASNGRGGIFPLKNPGHDESKRELWFQLMDYLRENDDVREGG